LLRLGTRARVVPQQQPGQDAEENGESGPGEQHIHARAPSRVELTTLDIASAVVATFCWKSA